MLLALHSFPSLCDMGRRVAIFPHDGHSGWEDPKIYNHRSTVAGMVGRSLGRLEVWVWPDLEEVAGGRTMFCPGTGNGRCARGNFILV